MMSNHFANVFIPWPEWRIVGRLGSGGFGSVYRIERTFETGDTPNGNSCSCI